ncbi:MAG: hypothetical protein LBV54_00335 [Puniceicoccales bacterium]|jgi:chromosome segregation ATPase|nr:hypothetical protein [Puniceicoccales bacterium]
MTIVRTLAILNLLGVILLGTLCGYQWKNESRLMLEVNGLLQVKDGNEKQIAAHEKTIAGQAGDITLFKSQLSATREELAQTTKTLRAAERDNARLTQDCEQLKANIEIWKEAVKDRDEHIAEANERIKDLVERVNEGVLKYNELAKKHNDLVALVNTTREQLAQAYKDLDDTRRKLYKALGQKVPDEAPSPNPAPKTPEASPGDGVKRQDQGEPPAPGQ